jgi:O-antigen ligase/tetratricopeptide (TPR) repeat protein
MLSNFERMEGFVGHIHLYAYFLILVAMLPTLKEWKSMFKAFVTSNILILLYATGQFLGAKSYFFAKTFPKAGEWFAQRFAIHMSENRLDATIGNSAYFAIFCLMFVFIYALLWVQKEGTKKVWFYPTLIVLNLIALFYSGTRGTMIGAIVGGLITLALIAWYEKGKAKQILITSIVGLVIILSAIFIFKDTALIKNSPTLSRLASISPKDVTTMSRLTIWKISYDAFLERPILGYGQDNFGYIFARKFVPEKMWNLEPWYDRSHDVFFDWLVAAGILGLLSYLSLYFVTLWIVWKKDSQMPIRERAIITGAIAGYFVHNIFVFDNLTSYILFIALIAYVVVRSGARQMAHHGKSYADNDMMTHVWIPATMILLLVTLYYVNYRPIKANRLVIDGMTIGNYLNTMSFPDAVKRQKEDFTSAIAMNTIGSLEAREQFFQMIPRMVQIKIPDNVPQADRQAAIGALLDLMQAGRDEVARSYPYYKDDVRMLSIYGMFYNGIGDYAKAEEILKHARTIAPKKQLVGFDLTRALLIQNKADEAYAVAREVYDYAPAYGDAKKWFILSAIYAKKYKEAEAHIEMLGQKIDLDQDILMSLVSSGQTQLALEILAKTKREHPELSSQIDGYMSQLLQAANKKK